MKIIFFFEKNYIFEVSISKNKNCCRPLGNHNYLWCWITLESVISSLLYWIAYMWPNTQNTTLLQHPGRMDRIQSISVTLRKLNSGKKFLVLKDRERKILGKCQMSLMILCCKEREDFKNEIFIIHVFIFIECEFVMKKHHNRFLIMAHKGRITMSELIDNDNKD